MMVHDRHQRHDLERSEPYVFQEYLQGREFTISLYSMGKDAEHVEKLFGRSGAALTYVADNSSKDLAAPHALGWTTVQIVRPGRIHDYVHRQTVPADRMIETLGQL